MASIQKQAIAPKKQEIPAERIKELYEFLNEVSKASTRSYLIPDGNPNKEWNLSIGKKWDEAEVAAIRKSMEAAANEKTIKPEWSAANIKGPYMSPTDNPWGAASCAIWNSTTKAAKDEGRLEALNKEQPHFLDGEQREDDIELMARLILVKDLRFEGKEKYLDHAAKRLKVWEKGYALVNDVNGVLYVYGGPQFRGFLRQTQDSESQISVR